MKKTIAIAMMVAMMATVTTAACPKWECQLMPNDYSCCSCGGHCRYTSYNECSQAQAIYCQYCGHEMWDCICGRDYSQDCYEEESCGYAEESYSYGGSCSGSAYMQHWANIRDCYGNIVGQAGCGDYVEIIGEECSTGRVIIYHYDSGIQGSVLAECVYGGYQWDGTGDNGAYNSYQGDACESWDNEVVDCGYSECGSGSGSYQSCPIGGGYYVSYTEMVNIFRQYVAGGYGYGFGGCR